jgi:hypothetical protein
MGRLRKTSEELERKGSFKTHPERARARAKEPDCKDPLGPPPDEFLKKDSITAERLLNAWKELLLATKEVRITSADRPHFIMTCRLMVRCNLSGAKTGDFAQYNKCLSQLGLNPAARSTVEGTGGAKSVGDDEQEWHDLHEEGAPATVQ